jgi:hypothetical protein
MKKQFYKWRFFRFMVGKIVGDANIKKMCHDGYAAQA